MDIIEKTEDALARIPEDDFNTIYDFIISQANTNYKVLVSPQDVAVYNHELGQRRVADSLKKIRNRANKKNS